MNHGRWGGWRLLGAVLAVLAGLCANTSAASAVSVQAACARPVAPGYAQCFALRRTDVANVKADALADSNVVPSGYGPADLQDAYQLASAAASSGGGQTIGIVDAYHDPTAESDLGVYRSQYGLPACTTANSCLEQVDLSGGKINTGWAGETSLDLDMVSAICPSCHILLVEAASAGFGNLGTAINTAVSMGADAVSNSWGGNEFNTETNYDAAYLNHPGIAITASTGDSGFGPQWPAASPLVTAVGGTSLQRTGAGWTESAWSGAGAGCSFYEPKPTAWQTDTGCARRSIGDVSAVANPATGVAVYQTTGASGWTVYGGTSVSAPIIASVYALAGTPGPSDNPASYPYRHLSALNDVTSGSDANSCSPSYLCFAGPGYDGPTGLGTPRGVIAFTANGLASTTTLVAYPNPANAGDAVTLTATVTSGGAAPTGIVTFLDGGTSLGTALVGAGGQAVLSTTALAGGHHSLVASYGGDDTHGPSSSAPQDEVINAPQQATAAPPQAPPATGASGTPSIAGSPLLTCNATPIALIDVVPQGSFVRVTGVASTAYRGKTVQILLGSKVVAVAAVRSDGSFQALANLPSRRARSTARYSAAVAGVTSAALKLRRRSYLTTARVSGGSLTLAGKVTGPFRPGAKVSVEEIARCTTVLRIATARLSPTGAWRVTVGVSGDVGSVLFRARTTVLSGRRSSTTVSLPHPATG